VLGPEKGMFSHVENRAKANKECYNEGEHRKRAKKLGKGQTVESFRSRGKEFGF
jgi:hypothetical protein